MALFRKLFSSGPANWDNYEYVRKADIKPTYEGNNESIRSVIDLMIDRTENRPSNMNLSEDDFSLFKSWLIAITSNDIPELVMPQDSKKQSYLESADFALSLFSAWKIVKSLDRESGFGAVLNGNRLRGLLKLTSDIFGTQGPGFCTSIMQYVYNCWMDDNEYPINEDAVIYNLKFYRMNRDQKAELVNYDKTLLSLFGSSEVRRDILYAGNGVLRSFEDIAADMEGIAGESERITF